MSNVYVISFDFATDIITNSSSVVYTMARTPKHIHDLFNEFLGILGSDKKSEDIFDVVIVPSLDVALERIMEDYGEYEDVLKDTPIPELKQLYDSQKWPECKPTMALMEKELAKLFVSGELKPPSGDGYMDTYYTISARGGDVVYDKLAQQIHNLFDNEGTYTYDG